MKIDVATIRKFLMAIAAGLAQLLIALADERVTTSEWVMVMLAGLGAIGVYAIPNAVKMRRDDRGRFAPVDDE